MMTTMRFPRLIVADNGIYRWAFISLLCAALALVIAPEVFGPLGVAVGTVAVWKGGRWWGVAGVYASAVAGLVGAYLVSGLMA